MAADLERHVSMAPPTLPPTQLAAALNAVWRAVVPRWVQLRGTQAGVVLRWHAARRLGQHCHLGCMDAMNTDSVARLVVSCRRCGTERHAKSDARTRFKGVSVCSDEGASRLLAAGSMGALLCLLNGACHAALLPLALSTLAGAAAARSNAFTSALL